MLKLIAVSVLPSFGARAGHGQRLPAVAPHALQHARAQDLVGRAGVGPLVDDDAILLEQVDVGLHPLERSISNGGGSSGAGARPPTPASSGSGAARDAARNGVPPARARSSPFSMFASLHRLLKTRCYDQRTRSAPIHKLTAVGRHETACARGASDRRGSRRTGSRRAAASRGTRPRPARCARPDRSARRLRRRRRRARRRSRATAPAPRTGSGSPGCDATTGCSSTVNRSLFGSLLEVQRHLRLR